MTRYCKCRSKRGDGFMIYCERCEEWFHGRCVDVTKKHGDTIENYFCDECLKNNPDLKITYKEGKEPVKKSATVKQEPLEERKQEKKVTEKTQSTSAPLKPKAKPAIPVHQQQQHQQQQQQQQPKVNQGKRKYNRKANSKSHSKKQCSNPECIYEARQDSKYCSEECGYTFNKLRYETHFIPKWRILEENHSQARLKKMKDIDQLEKDRVEVEQLIKNLKQEKEELEQNISLIKEQAKRLFKENANSKENDEEDMEMDNEDVEEFISGDASKTYCATCGHTIQSIQAFKHWYSCHKKQEAIYNFTADVMIHYSCKEDENPKLYCYHQDKKTKRYCMHIESACPQHSNWHSDKDEVCGCPLNIMQKLVPDGNYCLELKKDCTQHYHWDKFRLAQMNMQRAQAFSKLDSINDRIRIATNNLADTYGGVVGVMLHNTISHSTDKDAPDLGPSYDQEDIDIEMTNE